jgi:DHA3 family macrolide efflux protein-like MFS transporter
MSHFLVSKKTRPFLTIWLGQFLSIIGSGMTSFVMAIWSYQRHWSTGQFSTVVLAAALPGIIMAPFAGALVDRWDKRLTMMGAVAGQAISTLVLALLFATNKIDSYWQVYPAIILIAVCAAFQYPALSAACAVLVPKDFYSQAGGLWQLNQAAVMIVSPILAAALLPTVHMQGIILFDALSYLFAFGSLVLIRIPSAASEESNADADAPAIPFLRQVAQGWLYIKSRRGLLQLLAYFLFFNLILDMVQIVVMPLAVKGGTPQRLASLMVSSAIGMVCGGAMMAAWSGPKNRVLGVLASGVLVGGALILAGPQQNPLFLAVAFFLFTLFIPLGQSSAGAIWLNKTPRELLGRVTATTSSLSQLCFPLACFVAPALTDPLFVPLLAPGGRLSTGPIAAFFGVGPQRGVGLLLTVMGLVTVLLSLAAAASKPLRRLEAELPEMSSLDEDDSALGQSTPAESKPADVMIARQVLVTGENQ